MKISGKILIIVFIALIQGAGTAADSLFFVETELSGGWSYKLNSYAEGPNYSRYGFPIGLRASWRPGKMLSAGVETGLLHLSSYEKKGLNTQYGKTNTDISLDAVPILWIFSMSKYDFELSAGIGVYYLYATMKADQLDYSQHSYEWDMGFLLSLRYNIPINSRLSLGPQIKYFSISERKEQIISPQVSLKYSFGY